MAAFVFTDAFFSATGVDLSDHVKSVTLNYSAELQDDTAMGDTTRSRAGGLKDWSMEVEFHEDFASAKVNATLWPKVGSTCVVLMRPVNATGVSATNPNFSGTSVLESLPVGGALGEMAATTATFQAAGALTRATS